ncbi:MAG: SRPBCC family protein [Colwellia sp.]|nr:SRPBCC family protein [Colwellia sp.]
MKNVHQMIYLNTSKQEAWNVLADFGNAHKYFDGIIHSHLTGEASTGVGTSRHCELPPMMGMKQYIDEEITDWQEGNEFTYIVTNTAAPIKNGIARWSVEGDEQKSTILVEITYQPKGIIGFFMQKMLQTEFNKQIMAGLNDIKRKLEAKQKPA